MKLKNKLMVAIPACALAVAPVVAATACSSKKEQPKTKTHVVPTAAQKTQDIENRVPAEYEFDLTDDLDESDLTVEAIDSTGDSIEIPRELVSVSEKKLHFVAKIKSSYKFTGDKTFTFSVKVTNNNASSQWSETVTDVKLNFTVGPLQSITLSMTETTAEYAETLKTPLTVTEFFPEECEIIDVDYSLISRGEYIQIDDNGYITALTPSGKTQVEVTATDFKGNRKTATCNVTNKNTITSLTIKADHNIAASNTTGYEFKVVDDKNRDQTEYVEDWEVEPADVGTFDGNKFTPASGLTEPVSAKVTATVGDATSAEFEIEIASFDLCDTTKLANGAAAKASTVTSLANANLLIPSRYYNVTTNGWKPITDIPSNAFNIADTVETIENVYIPKSILKNGFSTQAFGQTQIENIKVDPENADFTSQDQSENECNCVMLKKAGAEPDTIFKATINPFISTSIKTIGNDAFFNVKLVDEAKDMFGKGEASSGLTTIGIQAFKNCNLTKFQFGVHLSNINNYAFQDCANLTLEEDATAIGDDQLTNIGKYAFQGCGKLNIDGASFQYTTNLETIGEHAFEGCGQNTETEQSWADFSSCTKLTSIGNSCFQDLKNLSALTFPQSIEHIGGNVITGCGFLGTWGAWLGTVAFNGFVDGTQFLGKNDTNSFVWLPDEDSIDNADFLLGENGQYEMNKSTQFELQFDGSSVTISAGDDFKLGEEGALIMPTVHQANTTCDVAAIKDYGFQSKQGIKKLNLNNCASTLTSIGNQAFDGCEFLGVIYVDAYTEVPRGTLSIAEDALSAIQNDGIVYVNPQMTDEQIEDWKDFLGGYLPDQGDNWTFERLPQP